VVIFLFLEYGRCRIIFFLYLGGALPKTNQC
jgi:hypothetical protein